MKLKNELKQLNDKFVKRIEKGDYDVIKCEVPLSDGYIGEITISIDRVFFRMSLSDSRRFVCFHSPFKLDFEDPKSLEPLYKSFEPFRKKLIEKKISELQKTIKDRKKNKIVNYEQQ